MNVDLVIPEPIQQAGGIPRYVRHLISGLQEMDVNANCVPFRYLPGASRRSVLKALPVGVHTTPKAQITHFTQILGASTLLFRRRRAPTVVTVHDLGALLCPEDQVLNDWISRRLLKLSLAGMKRADLIIADSEFTKRCLVHHLGYPDEKVHVVWLGVDTDLFRPVPNARAELARKYGIHIAPDTKVVLYVGSEQPRKNLPVLVRALAALMREGHALHWIKVGPALHASSHQQLQRLIEDQGLSGRVTFVEDVPDRNLPSFYSAADVYVQPSVWEGFGLPVLEAMACGTPVVSSDATSLPEVAATAAHLVHAGDIGDVSDGIRRMLTDTRYRDRLVQKGQQRADRMSWRSTATQTVEIYANALGMET